MNKPLIGITSNFSSDDMTYVKQGLGAIGQEWSLIANDYSDAIIRSGGIPIVIPISEDEDYIKDIAKKIDGLLISGGADLDPLLSGQRADAKTGRVSPKRDKQELLLLDYIYKNTSKPILGICRGLQLMNVYFKGNLILDLPSAGYLAHSISNNERYNPIHDVTISEDTLLREIIGQEKTYVNTIHHQAVGELGQGLRIAAISEDNVIEAVETVNVRERFILATQWHPEMTSIKDSSHKRIFDYFINSAK
ncbi:MAG: gamma-glutamyl-gamma-aminobutyrate hydrolase family protein [Tissierellaceae bacterium]|nr:gamma-glutamyl-gamma-aminobutyrate hydrolase family protein [Tissierellaceae bacterium]